MEDHPSYSVLSPILTKYPRSAGGLFQAYNDIVYVQRWTDPEVIDLESCKRGAVKATRKGDGMPSYVLPCPLAENISFDWLKNAYSLNTVGVSGCTLFDGPGNVVLFSSRVLYHSTMGWKAGGLLST
ncbi:hypothetical protein APHAL10511_002771 [Amanita phalloides]|nr:hypothetical protein APHAL10511_002771 [Amanita phalloides]